MRTFRPLIVLEFNELCPSLMSEFISAGDLPNFKKLRDSSSCYITDAGEEPPNLEPWIQWVTVHTGQPFSQHRAFHLGDAAGAINADSIWDVVSDEAHSVWVCGSMNASARGSVNGWFLPDPWSVRARPTPTSLNSYFDFVRAQVMDYTRKGPPGLLGSVRFLSFMATHGLRPKTVLRILAQLLRERLADVHWQRAMILDALQFDLFLHGYRRLRPTLSTLFFNSTAHFQHVYWRNMQPDIFSVKPSAREQLGYCNAIRQGYVAMDRMVGETLSLAGDQTSVALVTALSQQPCLKYESTGGKRFYKVLDHDDLLRYCAIDPSSCSYEPVMSEQFHLRFALDSLAQAAVTALRSLRVDGEPALTISVNGQNVFAGCRIFRELSPGARIEGGRGAVPFSSLFYLVDLTKSGMHHPDGIFWLRVPGKSHEVVPGKLPLVEVAPILLRSLGVAR